MDKIREVLEKVHKNKELRRTIIPLFIGNPGLGKSAIPKQFAKDIGVNMVELITSQRNPFEVSGMPMPNRDTNKVDIWDFDTLLTMKDGDILFFDELLNGNPATLNACLTLLENRTTISGKKLADIMIIAAANPQGMTPITPQIKERFVWYTTKFNSSMWKEYMFKKYRIPNKLSNMLCTLITNETFSTKNFYTPRSIDKAINMIINGAPTPYFDVLFPILSTFIKNELGEPIKLTEDKNLEPDETISWLDLVRQYEGIDATVLFEEDKVDTSIEDSKFEIDILDTENNIVGKMKNVIELRRFYNFSDTDIMNLNKGKKILLTPLAAVTGPPDPSFFQKKIK